MPSADDVLRQGVQGICDLITEPGLINVDFADVRTIMEEPAVPSWASTASRPERTVPLKPPSGRLALSLVDTEVVGARGILLDRRRKTTSRCTR